MKKLVTFPIIFIASIYVFVFEELVWEPAVALLFWVRRSRVASWIESWVEKRKGWQAIVTVFIVPGIPIYPLKLGAIYLMGHGHPYFGVVLFFSVKVVATAIFAQLYTLVGKECEKVRWFHKVATFFRSVRTRIQSHWLYQRLHTILATIKTKLRARKSRLKARLIAAIRRLRKK